MHAHSSLPSATVRASLMPTVMLTFGDQACKHVQANYQLVLPDMEAYLSHIGAQPSWSGVAIGCCDVATLPGALGKPAHAVFH